MIKYTYTLRKRKKERKEKRKKIFNLIRFFLFSCLTAIILYLFVWLGLALDTTI